MPEGTTSAGAVEMCIGPMVCVRSRRLAWLYTFRTSAQGASGIVTFPERNVAGGVGQPLWEVAVARARPRRGQQLIVRE
jgi:hypothetical protein